MKMPLLYVGHGSPMNVIEKNTYTNGWKEISYSIPTPKVILSISAHWENFGTKVCAVEKPKTIHDFYGFPEELYKINYNASGSPEYAKKLLDILKEKADEDLSWGLDHGTWSVLRTMYPDADIPVFQMSLDGSLSNREMFEIGNEIKGLREQGVLIMGSGNIVHNLRMINFSFNGGYDWAHDFNDYIIDSVMKKNYEDVIEYQNFGDAAKLSVPTSEHFNPLLYVLGATEQSDEVNIYNNSYLAGSLSMTSFLFK